MKKTNVLIITCMLLSVATFGQINILKKITKKVEEKTEQKIDEGIEKGVNEVFEGDYKNETTSNDKNVEPEKMESSYNSEQSSNSNLSNESVEEQIKELLKSNETKRFMYIKNIIEPYNSIDEAINHETFNLLVEVLFSVPKKKYEHLQTEKNRNEAPEHFDGMIKEFQKELEQEIKDYFELINILITKGAKVGYLNNDGNNTLTLFLKSFESLRRIAGIDLTKEKDKIYELIVDKASGIDIIFAAQNIFELEPFKKAVDRASDINLVVET